jgi:hypothetical protein
VTGRAVAQFENVSASFLQVKLGIEGRYTVDLAYRNAHFVGDQL